MGVEGGKSKNEKNVNESNNFLPDWIGGNIYDVVKKRLMGPNTN